MFSMAELLWQWSTNKADAHGAKSFATGPPSILYVSFLINPCAQGKSHNIAIKGHALKGLGVPIQKLPVTRTGKNSSRVSSSF